MKSDKARKCAIALAACGALLVGGTAAASSETPQETPQTPTLPDAGAVSWGATVVNDFPQFADQGPDARGEHPGRYGSQFPRVAKLADGSYVLAYTFYDNDGYTYDPNGGTRLGLAVSTDLGRTWSDISSLAEAGRDLDNGYVVELDDGTLLVAYRSVRWAESYRILVRRSTDGGLTWSNPVTVDASEGQPGSLSNPDRGVYEPAMVVYPDGRVGLMYANEKYALSTPAYSQVISLKISDDGGLTWGNESFAVRDLDDPTSRPGMPIWTQTTDGSYILAYELCGTDSCNAWVKTSSDGETWGDELGQRVPEQLGAPYVIALSDGRLMLTSNTHKISVSRDGGSTWYVEAQSPWGPLDYYYNLWPAIIQTGASEVGVITSVGRVPLFNNGHSIQIKFGTFASESEPDIVDGGVYTLTNQLSGQNLDIDGGSLQNGAAAQQWPRNGATPENWILTEQPGGAYTLENQNSGKLLDVDGNSTADGARVQQWEATTCDCQQWYLDYVGGGNYRVRAKHSGKNLDLPDGSLIPATHLRQWPETGAAAQRWRLTLVG
jgi:hypothetical protein